ncbi:MAG: 4-hydroxy-tetrahydrodipicolinate reductase [Phycisphaerae bacterium]|nr:4-hydroxy-tetrahydrodipicolinate reductase [Phycisphaerae bacterium]
MADPIRVAIAGGAGRMGRRLVALAHADAKLKVTAATEAAGHASLGADAGELAGVGKIGVPVSADLPAGVADVLIDFTVPQAAPGWVALCEKARVAMVIGTTGLDAAAERAIEAAAENIPIVHAPNMSVGVNVLFRVVGELARALGDGYDIEISETHHRFKLDAPSGTAMGLAKAICQATGRDVAGDLVHGRSGQVGKRTAREIGMHALRMGDTVGEHTVSFGALGETVTIGHSAHTRDTFAAGALRAAAWLAAREPGLYSMQDVLFGDK